MNDRFPYADVSIAAVLVVVGIALAAYPWLEGAASFLIAGVAGLAVLATLAASAAAHVRPLKPKNVTSGELPWT